MNMTASGNGAAGKREMTEPVELGMGLRMRKQVMDWPDPSTMAT